MHIREKLPRFEAREQARHKIEIRLIDQLRIRLKGVGAVRHAIEDRARLGLIQQMIEVGIDKQIDLLHIARWQSFEPPRGQSHRRPIDVFTMLKQRAQEICTNKSAPAQHKDRPLEALDLLLQGELGSGCSCGGGWRWRVIHVQFSKSEMIDSASSPHSRR